MIGFTNRTCDARPSAGTGATLGGPGRDTEARARTQGRFFSSRVSLWGLLSAATAVACVGTVLGFLGDLWWAFELTSHFRVQYLVALAAASLAFVLARKYRLAGVALGFALLNLWLIAPLYVPSPAAGPGPRIRAVLMNVSISNDSYDRVSAFVRSTAADLVLVEEVNQRWLGKLKEIMSDYPHTRSTTREDEFGIALFSRIPFERAEIGVIGELEFPYVKVAYCLGRNELAVIGIHCPPPVHPEYIRDRVRQVDQLAGIVRSVSGPVMVMGDLNMTSWSPIFGRLTASTGLRDSRMGFGIQPTWPVQFPWLRLPIDHCLVSKDVRVLDRQVGPNIGSDHFPLAVDLLVSEPFVKPEGYR